MTVEAIICKAKYENLKQIAITDHFEQIPDIDYYVNMLKWTKNNFETEILLATELSIDKYTKECDKHLDKFDFVIGSFHGYPPQQDQLSADNYNYIEYKAALDIINNPRYDVLGHAGGQNLKFYKAFSVGYMCEIIRKCVETDTVFELNYARHFEVKDQLHKWLAKYNPYVCFGSDAHVLGNIGKSREML